MFSHARRTIALILTVTTTLLCGSPRASAMLAPASVSQSEADMQKVQAFLEQKQVRQRLTDFGLTQEQIESRLQKLSDADIHQVALQVDKQNPAADGGGVVITVLMIGVLALLFVYLAKRV